MDALRVVEHWPVGSAAVGVAGATPTLPPATTVGPTARPFPWASVTKPATALAVLVAVEEGTLGLDQPAGPLRDLLALGREWAVPTLVSAETHDAATSVHFPELAGVLPGFQRFDPCPWGLGVEIRGTKWPHWTGRTNSPSTYGHFGRTGSFLWIDPVAGLVCAGLADRPFGPWAAQAWPQLADAILAESSPPPA